MAAARVWRLKARNVPCARCSGGRRYSRPIGLCASLLPTGWDLTAHQSQNLTR